MTRGDVASNRFAGKVVLVTGAASGIGEATARLFAGEGASVLVVDLNEEGARRVADEIAAAGGSARPFRADVAEPADAERMIHEAVAAWGRLDVLHNNATASEMALIADATVEGWTRTIAVNLTAAFLATRAALPVMIAQGGGAIVNMSSGAGLMAEHGLSAYCAAKAGIVSFTRSIAIEYARHGIRANCICPGAIATPPLRAICEAIDGARERMERSSPLRRLGTPEEVARVVLFLASEEASFVTGAAYLVDGGSLASKETWLLGGAS